MKIIHFTWEQSSLLQIFHSFFFFTQKKKAEWQNWPQISSVVPDIEWCWYCWPWLEDKILQYKLSCSFKTPPQNTARTSKSWMTLLFSLVFSFTCISSHQLWVPGSAPFPLLENNILRFHTKGIRLRNKHHNCTISLHKHIERRCHHTENSVCEVCYGLFSIRCTCDKVMVTIWWCFLTDYYNYCFMWHV